MTDIVEDASTNTSRVSGQRLSKRGTATRARLVVSARRVFERLGFPDSRVADIAAEAKVAHGSFYTYFSSKEEILREVVLSLRDEQLGSREDGPAHTPYEQILRANRHFFESYRRNAAMIAVIEQIATMNDAVLQIRIEMRAPFVTRAEQAIRRMQQDGLADASLDPHYVANALGAMVDRFAYIWLVLGEPFDFETAVVTLSELWANAIKLDRTASGPPLS